MISNAKIVNRLNQYISVISHVENWMSFFIYKIFGGSDSFTLRLRHSFPMKIEGHNMDRFYSVFQNKKYLQPLMDKRAACPEPVIVDVGAGKGYFALCALYHFPRARLIAFEPNPASYKILKYHASLISDWSFSAYNCSVNKTDGLVNYHAVAELQPSPGPSYRGEVHSAGVLVSVYKLATLRKKYKINRIHLLKITIQGGEYEILYHLTPKELQQIDQISMDIHYMNGGAKNLDNMIGFLMENNYDVLRHPVSLAKSDAIIWARRKDIAY